MKKLFTFGLICFNMFAFCQNDVAIFGLNDVYYLGGYNKLFSEMVEIAKSKNLQSCPSSQTYNPSVLIEKDGAIKFVKDEDSLTIADNKCAYDFSKKVLPYLKNWKPLQIKGESHAAIARFPVNPFYVSHSNANPALNKSTKAEFPKGINNFRMYVGDIFSKELNKNKNRTYYLTFTINEEGNIANVKIEVYPEEKIENEEFLRRQVLNIKEKWKPATFNGIPMATKMKLPMKQEFDMDWEQQIQEDKFKKFDRN